MPAAAKLTRHPARLAALCTLWRQEGREVHLILQGASMSPTIPPGSCLRLTCADTKPAVGDVIAALRGDRLVIHRLIRIDEEPGSEPAYVCRGDANRLADPPVSPAQIVGVVRQYRPPSRAQRAYQALFRRLHSSRRLLTRAFGHSS